MSATERFRFRLRFRVANKITSDTREVLIDSPELPNGVALTSQNPSQKIGETDWLVLGSRGYRSEQEARANGRLLANALLLAAAQRSMGADVGADQTTSGMEAAFRTQIQTQQIPITTTVHGLDVFEDIEVRVFRLDAHVEVGQSIDMFIAAIRQMLSLATYMNDKEHLCGQLINDSLFPATPESALIILMTCIELLCGSPARRQQSVVHLLDALGRHLEEIEGNEADRNEVRDILGRGKRRSISRFCSNRIKALLNEARALEFDVLYDARSRFAHDGRGRASLFQEAGSARRLATDLLIAHLQKKQAPGRTGCPAPM